MPKKRPTATGPELSTPTKRPTVSKKPVKPKIPAGISKVKVAPDMKKTSRYIANVKGSRSSDPGTGNQDQYAQYQPEDGDYLHEQRRGDTAHLIMPGIPRNKEQEKSIQSMLRRDRISKERRQARGPTGPEFSVPSKEETVREWHAASGKKRRVYNGDGRKLHEVTGDKEEYTKFFNSAMKKFGVTSPDQLKGGKEKEFYD